MKFANKKESSQKEFEFFWKDLNVKKNYTKSEQIMPNIPCSHETSILDNSSKKKRNSKNLFSFDFYAGPAF